MDENRKTVSEYYNRFSSIHTGAGIQVRAHDIEHPGDDIEALKCSVAKWLYIYALTVLSSERVHDGGMKTCALCQKYAINGSCLGCPVIKATVLDGCMGNVNYQAFRRTGDGAYALREAMFLIDLLAEHGLVDNAPVPKDKPLVFMESNEVAPDKSQDAEMEWYMTFEGREVMYLAFRNISMESVESTLKASLPDISEFEYYGFGLGRGMSGMKKVYRAYKIKMPRIYNRYHWYEQILKPAMEYKHGRSSTKPLASGISFEKK